MGIEHLGRANTIPASFHVTIPRGAASGTLPPQKIPCSCELSAIRLHIVSSFAPRPLLLSPFCFAPTLRCRIRGAMEMRDIRPLNHGRRKDGFKFCSRSWRPVENDVKFARVYSLHRHFLFPDGGSVAGASQR
ncbi:unnamed protein product [Phaeothamnion confervicola]